MQWTTQTVTWAVVALLLFAAEAMAPGAFMLWLGFAAAAVFLIVLALPGVSVLAQVAAGNPVLVMQNLGLDWWPQWHFAVVVGFDRSRQELVLRSATTKRWLTDFAAFDITWRRAGRWAVVTVPPDRLPAEAQLQPWLQGASDLEETGQREAAETAYRTALHQWPREPMPAFALGNARYAAGDRAEPRPQQSAAGALCRERRC